MSASSEKDDKLAAHKEAISFITRAKETPEFRASFEEACGAFAKGRLYGDGVALTDPPKLKIYWMEKRGGEEGFPPNMQNLYPEYLDPSLPPLPEKIEFEGRTIEIIHTTY